VIIDDTSQVSGKDVGYVDEINPEQAIRVILAGKTYQGLKDVRNFDKNDDWLNNDGMAT